MLKVCHLTLGGVLPKTSQVVTQFALSYPQSAW